MKKLFIALGVLAVAGSAHAADVGVSISVGQPGFYGRIDIGNAPQPQLIFAAPVVIRAPAPHVVYQPMYLRVPPGHEKKWNKKITIRSQARILLRPLVKNASLAP